MDSLDREPEIGPLKKDNLAKCRASDFVAVRNLADSLNAALRYCVHIAVSQKYIGDCNCNVEKSRDALRLLHPGDVVVALEDLPKEQQEIAREIMAQRDSTVVGVGEVVEGGDGAAREAEAIESVYELLVKEVDKLFASKALMAQLCKTGRISLPLGLDNLRTIALRKLPLGNDQRYHSDEGFRRQRNEWFSNRIIDPVCRRLRDHFLDNILPSLNGTIYMPAGEFKWRNTCGKHTCGMHTCNRSQYRGFARTRRILFSDDDYTISMEDIKELNKQYGEIMVALGNRIDSGTGHERVVSVPFVEIAKACLDGTLTFQRLEDLLKASINEKPDALVIPHHGKNEPQDGTILQTFREMNLQEYFRKYFYVVFSEGRRLYPFGDPKPDEEAVLFTFLDIDPLDPGNKSSLFHRLQNLGCHIVDPVP
ncbi:hypothetical protein HY604_00770 [Candidatus Peregrinibacteria bacterium]|nr:hypothetical protein [Candidatus Peregrinibacteria bacterium]